MTPAVTFVCNAACKSARSWPYPRYGFQALGLCILQNYGQEWYSERASEKKKKNNPQGSRDRGWNNTSFNSAVNVWGCKFSTNAGNNIGKVQGNEDTRISLPCLLTESGPKFAVLTHTKQCSREKKKASSAARPLKCCRKPLTNHEHRREVVLWVSRGCYNTTSPTKIRQTAATPSFEEFLLSTATNPRALWTGAAYENP